ncbi:hypothetical protein LTR10_014715 [Elasticomyces elasticus]|uniref:Conidiation-specific protein 6 n=1 Tax=Exophiala sideris TaxID=1016849 RepID=A0ABR0J7B8_9EURO|nr:hypothetical protein LTR10_014715 [Elasticomyces elasticus]KAK5029360.1 hypothetical protein LTS07_005822 [Exophiala sideris]KAK5036943.1 hypothetical protein LTR13_005323 [Exophiala sideris]KAK5057990.1 hypothetical protein LTR69_006987 [Exophiala sideris]KAK5181949.1 hypothetical protein LTR44_005550 [Eurotiomycetes sp. CCFEE 6388]
MYHLKGQAADRNTSDHSHDEANDHINSGKEIMMDRANNARQLEDHPNLRLDGDKHAPDHSQPASHRHMKEVNHKVNQGEIEPERKRSVMDQVKHAVNPDSA